MVIFLGKIYKGIIHHLVLSIILVPIFGICVLCGWISLDSWPSPNRYLWKLHEPSAYYMEVIEGPYDGTNHGYWHWGVYVEEGESIKINLLNENVTHCTDMKYRLGCDSFLDPHDLDMDQLFDKIEDFCDSPFNKRELTCPVEFDPWFRYPKRFYPLLYGSLHLTVVEFQVCEEINTNCGPKLSGEIQK